MSNETKAILKSKRVFKSPFEDSNADYAGTKLKIDADKIKRAEELLNDIEGQELACQSVKEYLFGINHRSHEKGLGGSLLFAGAPAVGKTILAERIAKLLNRPFLRIDMSTKNDRESSVFELFGIHQSYKAAEEGILTKFVKENPVSVVLADELEKAHPNVINAFLQVIERGEIEDKYTKKLVNFRDVIIIFTTNVGKDIYNKEIGKYIFANTSESTLVRALSSEIRQDTKAPYFSEALVSRLSSGKMVMFNRLRPEVIHRILVNDIKKQVNFIKHIYSVDTQVQSELLAQLLILKSGENADIRGLLKSSSEMFDKCVSCGAETATDAESENLFDKIKIQIDLEDGSSEVKELLNNTNKSRVLVYCKSKDKKKFTQHESEKIEFIFADASLDVKNIPTLDVTAVIIDVESRNDPASRKLFDYCAKVEELPTYVYSTKDVGRSFFYYYVNSGATECHSPRLNKGSLKDFIGKIVGGLDLSYIAQTLFRSCKVVNFDIDYEYDRDSHLVNAKIHSLRVETAMDASHKDAFVGEREIPNVKFDDVIGAEEAKTELMRAAKVIKNYKKYLRDGIRVPRGMLLEGEPGTGKTMLAKAFASELGLPFIQKNATEFLIKWVGDGAKSIRELFATARRYSPCVIFVDEIDVIAKSRTDNPSDSHHTQDLTNAFLSELDGFANDTGAPVFVICATNFSTRKGESALDSAFLRRFDKKIHVELPKNEEREKFLALMLSRVKGSLVTEEKIKLIAKRSVGWSLADLNLVIQNAVRRYEDEKGSVGVDDAYLNEEFEGFSDGRQKTSKDEDIKKTAIHEAGHAVVGNALGIPSVYTTIISRGNYGGYVYFADEEKTTYTKDELLNKICMALAGRASEVLEYGEAGINTGAGGDIKTASNIARNMICSYGMVDGCFLFLEGKGERMPDFVIEKAQAILSEQYNRALKIVKERKNKIDRVAKELMDKNSLSEEELEALLTDTAN